MKIRSLALTLVCTSLLSTSGLVMAQEANHSMNDIMPSQTTLLKICQRFKLNGKACSPALLINRIKTFELNKNVAAKLKTQPTVGAYCGECSPGPGLRGEFVKYGTGCAAC